MGFDLKSFRENKLKMSQTQLAELLGGRQDTISRMEKNPSQITVDILVTLATKTGLDMNQLLSYTKPEVEPLNVDPTWPKVDYMKHTVVDYVSKFLEDYRDTDGTHYRNEIKTLQDTVDTAIRKPKVVVLGRSDSGKSTMINAIIGKDKMPTDYTPVTSVNVYIKHIDDRPAYIEEELWIFKKDGDSGWDDSRLYDEDYCRSWKIAGGSAEMLAEYGTRRGDKYKSDEVGSAVIFVDSPILKNVDLVDVPGFTGGIQSDNKMAQGAKKLADVLIYLSPSNGFMSNEDTVFLKDAIRVLGCPERAGANTFGPLSNIYVVATQAHIINGGNPGKLEEILDSGCNRFWSCLTDKFWNERSAISGIAYTKEQLRKRFFSYTTDIASLRLPFEDDLRSLVENLPSTVQEKATTVIKAKGEEQGKIIDGIITQYTSLLNERETVANNIRQLEENEPERRARTAEQKKKILSSIVKCGTNSRKKFQQEYSRILDVDHIVNTIESRGYKSKKDDMQALCSYISSELEDSLEEVVTDESKTLTEKINDYIGNFEANCNFEMADTPRVDMNQFNARRAFASGLTGAATFGGLALWASSVGNLGGYILVAKGVSLLSTLGISVGGTAAATSAVAAIGGPVVLGVALAVIAALGVFAAFTGGWKKKVAKKLYEAYMEQNALAKYNDTIDKFWEDTQTAFETASDEMESQWSEYLNDMRDKLNNYDVEQLTACIEKGKEVKHFFENIPL